MPEITKNEEYKNYEITIIPMEDEGESFRVMATPLLPEMEGWHDDFEVEGSINDAYKIAQESVDANYRLYNESIPS